MSTEKSPEVVKAVFTVSRKTYITPHYIRVYLTGKDVPKVANATVGVNNKILIPPRGVNKIHFPELDSEKKQLIHPVEEEKPYVRTYTHRGIDLEKNEIWIDFVAHGDEGPASAWAIYAREGDPLGVMMRSGKSELYPAANWYLLAGDATAIPVLSAILENLPSTAKGLAVIEVHSKEDEQELATKADFEIAWLHNQQPQKNSKLADYIKKLSLPEGSKFSYIAAEFSTVKAIRNYLRKEQKWKREELYAYSYWKAGVAEDRSAKERRKESSER